MSRALYFIGCCLLLAVAGLAHPATFPETATVFLQKNDGTEVAVGRVKFGAPANGNTGFTVDIDHSAFTEHFLSMRPFRCLESDSEWFCYLPYPYDLQATVTADDLSDLEYSLLFIRKLPSEFGIDAWNGLYYKLAFADNGDIVGKLLEGDLNVLQSPPADKYAKPINLEEFIAGSTDKRLFPALVIR